MTVNAELARELAADFLHYHAPAEVVAPELSKALGYRIDPQDLDLHLAFDVEALIEGVRIARQLLDGRGEEKLSLSGLLMLVEARKAVIAAREDWTDMTTNELIGWHPDSNELERWAESDSSDGDETETSTSPSATFGTLESSLTQAYRSLRGSPSS